MKNETLRKQIFQAALQIVEQSGMEELNARKIAYKSCCALGSIYTAFGNLEDLQLHVNATILSRLYDELHKTAEKGIGAGKSIQELFADLGFTYIEFGKNNTSLWKALFEYIPAGNIPDWYSVKAKEGIYRLGVRIASAYGIEEKEIKRVLGFFWSSIHGMSAIMLNRKMKMVAELFEDNYLKQYINYSLEGLFRDNPKPI